MATHRLRGRYLATNGLRTKVACQLQHIMSGDILACSATRLLDQHRVVVVYCASSVGERVGLAATWLESLG
ncbi:MAG: hypothetical protein JKY27_00850 [Magnetovibrio sp.]|nr:hypothetical protein [Magnetovibrio sp.]